MLRRLAKTAFLTMLLAAAEAGWVCGQEASTAKQLWGPEVRGAKLKLSVPTLLRVGQPVEIRAVVSFKPGTTADGKAPPGIILPKDDLFVFSVEITDARGQSVQFRVQELGSARSLPHWTKTFRVWPVDSHVAGRYWKPGVYQIRAKFAQAPSPMAPFAWHGELGSNKLRIEIADANTPIAPRLQDVAFRKRVLSSIAALDSPVFAEREAAEKYLEELGVIGLPLFEAGLKNASAEAGSRLKNLRKRIVDPFNKHDLIALPQPVGHFLAGLDDHTWTVLLEHIQDLKVFYRVYRARHMPLLRLAEADLVRLMDSPEPDARIRAVRSLQPTTNKETWKKLLHLLDDTYAEEFGQQGIPIFPVSQEAREAIIAQGEAIVPTLLQWPRGPHNGEVAKLLARIARLHPTSNTISLLWNYVGDSDETVRNLAADALLQLGKDVLPSAKRALVHKDKRVRTIAVAVIGNLKNDATEAVPNLVAALKDGEVRVRLAALDAIAMIGPAAKGAVPSLVQTIQDEDKLVRSFAVRTLGFFGPTASEAIEPLTEILHGKDAELKHAAALALGRVGKGRHAVVQTLMAILTGKGDPGLRASAVLGLGAMGPEARIAVKPMLQFLDREKENTERFVVVIQALGQIGPAAQEAIPKLSSILLDRRASQQARILAAHSLANIGPHTKPVLSVLAEAANDPDSSIRAEATAALKRIRAQIKE